MKKIILLFALAFIGVQLQAQNFAVAMTGNGATLTNATTVTVDKTVAGTYKQVSVQAVFTKVSGTVAGTGILYGSIDGVNYSQLNTDTLKMTNVTTNTKIWVVNNTNYMSYKVDFVGVGTMSGTVSGFLFPAFSTGAHGVVRALSNFSRNTDTIINTGDGYLQIQVAGNYNTVSIQSVVTRVTGTAGGTITVQGSNDNVNYTTVQAAYIDSQTQTITNVLTNSKIFIITGSPYSFYRLNYVGAGTMNCTMAVHVLPNK